MITIIHSYTAHYIVGDGKLSPTNFFYTLGDLPPNYPLPVPIVYTFPYSFIFWYSITLMREIMKGMSNA